VHTTNRDLGRDVVCVGWCVVTVRVTTLRGADAGAYYVEHLPNYYLDSGEPTGVWLGDGAHTLGLIDVLADESLLAVMSGLEPRHPNRTLGGAYGEKSVRGFDVTFSAPKSVSVLFAIGDDHTRGEALAAHDAAVTAVAGWIESRAHTRFRIGGDVAVVNAEGIIAARFRQHTSRALDPQIHTHLVIANRVLSPDGRWLALDARLLKHDQRSLSAIYHAALRAELTMRLGVEWNVPENGIAEIATMPAEMLAEFSSRAADVHDRIDAKLDRFIDTMGREPTPRERWKLEREAAVDSRPAKADGIDAAVLHVGWADQVRSLGLEPNRLVADVVGRVVGHRGLDDRTRLTMVDHALMAIGEKQSSWRPTELHRELGAVVPTDITVTAVEVVAVLDALADHITVERCVDLSRPVPDTALRRRDGRPVAESVIDRALTTQAILDQEQTLINWVDRRLLFDGLDNPAAATRSRRALDTAQTRAACAVAGHADIVFIVGPAGTGKTTALTPAVAQLQTEGRAVFGVAPSAAAADVLSLETGVVADTVDKLLIEHRLNRPPDRRYQLPAGATVIVDEAGMIPTARLAELADLADVRGWRIVMVGDPLQFSAVGRGGMFGLLVDTFGAIELDRVHRFTNDWERAASLQLRHGDPDVADIYDTNGRLFGGTTLQMERAAVDRWSALRADGKSTLLMAPTNDAVDRLNQRCQQRRIRDSEIDPSGPLINAGPHAVYVGDEIATRHNDRRLLTDRGEMVRNRATWTVDAVHGDGAITVTGRHGTVRLPADYVSEHVELAYATTGMGAQGRTVQRAIMFLDGPTDVRNLYVPMTRGTDTNEAFITTIGEQTVLDVFAQCLATDWIDQPALVRQADLANTRLHRPGVLDGSRVRDLFEQQHHIESTLGRAEGRVRDLPAQITEAQRSRTAAIAELDRWTKSARQAQDVLDRYDRPLHRRRHNGDINIANRDLASATNMMKAAHTQIAAADRRIDHLSTTLAEAKSVLAARAPLDKQLAQITDQLDHDLHIRTRTVSLEQPGTIADIIGNRPHPGGKAREWDRVAAQLDQHHAAYDGTDRTTAAIDHDTYLTNRRRVAESNEHFRPPTRRIDVAEISFGIEL
jgi:conjugative relaxase-like TrwC/TraI family protein